MRRLVLLLALACAAVWNVQAVDNDVYAAAQRFGLMYFAPMDGNFFRLYLPEGSVVEFCRNYRTGGIDGAGGWRASVGMNGDVMIQEPGARAIYTFHDGSPTSMLMVASNGRPTRYIPSIEDVVIPGDIPPMWEGAEEDAREAVAKKWNDGRLSLFYVNPNHAAVLLAELALIGLFAFLFGKWKTLVAAGAVGFAAAAFFLVRTDGRGGALGLAAGTLLLIGFRLFRRGGKIRVAVVLTLAVAAIAFMCVGSGLGGRFSLKRAADASTSARLEKWRSVPRMMVDSPFGWGTARADEQQAGRAYSDWYQPLNSFAVTPTLDSDHLTYMTGFGWFGRFVWGFVWLAVLFSLFRFSAGGGRGATALPDVGALLPLVEFSGLGVAAMFNPILHEWSLWIVPVASLGFFIASRPWKSPKKFLVPLAVAAAVSLLVCAGFYWAGREPSRSASLPIFTDGKRVFVGSRNPDVWVADDRYTIGFLNAPKEIRLFYSAYPKMKKLGYVQKLSDVPSRVPRLAVAGGLCREYVKLWEDGTAPKADELIFLSPGMPLDNVPESLRKSCKFVMVVGEFAARYTDVYGHLVPSDEVSVVTGAETYLPGWVGLILSM